MPLLIHINVPHIHIPAFTHLFADLLFLLRVRTETKLNMM